MSERQGRVADLQLHSSASDGSDPPAEVVRHAAESGFDAIALTDHDTMEGVGEAADAAFSLGIDLIPACELSTLQGTNDRQIDLLAYGVAPDNLEFKALLGKVRAARFGRAYGMVDKLNELGYPVKWERVQEIAGGENIGRPHVAKAMIEAGVVPDLKSAFTSEFIGDGGRCYVQRFKLTPSQAIDAVHGAGGVAIAAHPGRTQLSPTELEELLMAGLDGLEVFYPRHKGSETAHFLEIATSRGLLVTGGSDDHGAINEGRLMGSIRLPWKYVERLHAAIDARGGVTSMGARSPRTATA